MQNGASQTNERASMVILGCKLEGLLFTVVGFVVVLVGLKYGFADPVKYAKAHFWFHFPPTLSLCYTDVGCITGNVRVNFDPSQ